MRVPPLLLLGLLISLGLPAGPGAQETRSAGLAGTITLTTTGGVAPAGGTVIWIPGVAGAHVSDEPKIVSRGKRFEPHVLVVEAGARVSFPNFDQVYHNVFSLSAPNSFDLGLYRKGAVPTVVFKTPGLVRIYCNIHPDMAAYVMVVDSGAYAVTALDGSFRIAGVPPGRHPVKVWNERGGEQEAALDFEDGKDREYSVTLDASTYRALPHKNKHGRDYPPVPNEDRY